MISSASVFCMGVPENISIKAMPMTIPGMVLVTRAMLSMMLLPVLDSRLLAVTSAAP